MRLAHLVVSLLLFGLFPTAHAANLQDITQLYKKGKAEQALTELDSYLASLPKDSWGRNVTQARFLRGLILTEQKRTQEAIQVFTRLTLDYPELPEPYNNLAALYVAQGKYEAARDTLERAMRIDPTYAAMHANLGDVYAKLSAQAYEGTLNAATGKSAADRLKEACDTYGDMAKRAAGRKIAARADADFRLMRDIPNSRTAAAQPPAHVDIDEMAMESPAPATAPAAQRKQDALKTQATTLEEPHSVDKGKASSPADQEQDRKAITQALKAWSNAWSGKEVNRYLAFYAPDFKLPGGGSRAAWAAQRRERISKPKSIRVTVESPQISLTDATHAKVVFKQSYRSDTLQSSGHKTLLMVKTGGKWLIQEERVGGRARPCRCRRRLKGCIQECGFRPRRRSALVATAPGHTSDKFSRG